MDLVSSFLSSSMKASSVLQLFLEVAAKASEIATVIRKERALLNLLVEEKPEVRKNHQFFQDFKTLADVLIQETVRHFISQKVSTLNFGYIGILCCSSILVEIEIVMDRKFAFFIKKK